MTLDLTNSCMKETNRRYGMVMMFREATKKGGVAFEGKTIDEGSLVCVSPLLTHHEKDVFKDEMTWVGDRFTDRERLSKLTKNYQFAQFGYGRHRCLGKTFAESVILSCIAAVVS